LVIAIGSITNDFGTQGVAEHAEPLETPAEAARFNRRLVNACIRAQAQDGPVRPGQLHVAIVGAGATGAELAAELHRTTREVVTYGLDRIDPERDIRIVLIEAADRILPGLPERISEAARCLLDRMGIEVHTGARVTQVTADGLRLADGSFIASELVVWAAGVKAREVLRHVDGLEVNRINQLVVEPTLQTARDPDIFAIGDCAACPRQGEPTPVPPRAQAAHQEAAHLLRQIELRLRGKPLVPYSYRDFGSLVSLGKHSTVGNLMGFLFGRGFFIEGLFAGVMYRSRRTLHERALHGTPRALLGVEKATALVNAAAGRLPQWKAEAIVHAADEAIAGKLDDHFPLCVWQTGSGTQSNMNANEVLSNRGDRIARRQDRQQGAGAPQRRRQYGAVVERHLLDRWMDVVKTGRIHLMDAVPLAVGQEWSVWAHQIRDMLAHIRLELAAAGTASAPGSARHRISAVRSPS
jgi:NADH dehydrogenase FAD-containing subunit